MSKHGTLCAAFVVVAASSFAFATPINHGNRTGSTINYLNITEDSNTDPVPPALFGSPTIAADTLVFNPVSFGAFAQNGSFDITDGTLTTEVIAHSGQTIPSVTISERGDYTLAGAGTGATWCSVSLSAFVTVYEVNGAPITPFTTNFAGTFSPSGGTYFLPGEAGSLVVWNGSAYLDLNSTLASHGFAGGGATRIQVTFNNQLLAFSEPGTVAFIKKKNLQGITVTVPAPASVALVGLCGLVAARRRRA